MRNFDLRQFLNDNPLLKEESKAGKHISKLEVGEKFIYNDNEYTFIELYQDPDDVIKNAARVKLPNGKPSVVSFGDDGMVNTGEVAGTGVADMGLGKGHHIDEFLGFGKKKEEPEEEEEEEETGPEVEYEDGITFEFKDKYKDRLGDIKNMIRKKYLSDYNRDILKLSINPSKGEIYLSHPEGNRAYKDGTDIVEYLSDRHKIEDVKIISKIPKGIKFAPKQFSVNPPEHSEEEVEVDIDTAERMAKNLAKALQENEMLKRLFLNALAESGIDPSDQNSIQNAFSNPDILVQVGQMIDQAIKKSKEFDKEKSTTNELKASDALRQTVELGAIFGTVFGSISGNIPLAAAGGILLITAIILAPKEDKDDSVKERIDAGGMNTKTLHSVGRVIDVDTGVMYTINPDNTIDLNNPVDSYIDKDELSPAFINKLSDEDRAEINVFRPEGEKL